MSNPGDADATPIASLRQLAEHIAVGCKPRERFAIGTEHEKFGFRRASLASPEYAPHGIRAVLEGIAAGAPAIWRPILDHGNPIGLSSNTYAAISLEPAGQLELSGGLMGDLHATRAELEAHYAEVRPVVRSFLEKMSCKVTAVTSAEQALFSLDLGARFDLLLTDIALGAGMRGTELAVEAQRRYPTMPVLLMSGFSSDLLNADLESTPSWVLLRKPYSRQELARAITSVLCVSATQAPTR